MNIKLLYATAVAAGAVILLGQIEVGAEAPSAGLDGRDLESAGGGVPDVIVGALHERLNFGSDGNGFLVYSFGTTSCNIGTANLSWIASTNQHPVIGQNMFRVMPLNGHPRVEQIGQSWLKHGFFALSGTLCSGPGGCSGVPSGTALGVGCSDPYSALRNANQGSAGAKFEVNASTGFFPYPPTNPTPDGTISYGRLKVPESEMLPANNPGATWYAEGQYVHPEDSAADGGLPNNASFRGLNIVSNGSILSFAGATRQQMPGIMAWGEVDPTVTFSQIDLGADGVFFVGHNAWDNGDGTWDYEVAIQNHNCFRSGGSFSVPIPDGVTVSNIGFRDVDYHSGEPYDNTDWVVTVGATSLTWSSPETAQENPNSNALRWGTLYNFRFTADAAPQPVQANLGLFRPGAVNDVDVTVLGPGGTQSCAADIDGPGGMPDGNVDSLDFLLLIAQWGSPCVGSCEADITGPTPLTPDGNVDSLDYLLLIAQWGNPGNCP